MAGVGETVVSIAPGWTDERVARLRELWAAGWSCSKIAADLGHITRNSVIGKVHRLKLGGRGQPSYAARYPVDRPALRYSLA